MNTTPDDGNTIPEEWELSETRQTNGATVMFYQPTDR